MIEDIWDAFVCVIDLILVVKDTVLSGTLWLIVTSGHQEKQPFLAPGSRV